jgi:hypothetical protein
MVGEKTIRAYQLKTKSLVCPVCASDEEKADVETTAIAEDRIHDSDGDECRRCKKKLSQKAAETVVP